MNAVFVFGCCYTAVQIPFVSVNQQLFVGLSPELLLLELLVGRLPIAN